MAHKLREAVAAETAEATVSGTVEVDGAYFGGHVRPENMKADRRDRRLAENQTGKRRVVVVIRERKGKTITFAFRSEAESVPTIEARVEAGSVVHADEAKGWNRLHKSFKTHRVNHQEGFHSFRHSFKRMARDARLTEEAHDGPLGGSVRATRDGRGLFRRGANWPRGDAPMSGFAHCGARTDEPLPRLRSPSGPRKAT